jgi:predicted short-subunit dehydrogenase-like oxidoreductase (DUF2520 family)
MWKLVMLIHFIGCGRLGKTLATLIESKKPGSIGGIVNATFASAELTSKFIGVGTPYQNIQELPPADLYFITAPDDLIESLCMKLVENPSLPRNAIIVHCSGLLTSDVLKSATLKDCRIASIHPIKSFADPAVAIHDFSGTYCGFEGDEAAFTALKDLFENLNALVFKIKKESKMHYHAAMVIANNYLTTLHYHACKLLEHSDLDKPTAKKLVSKIMSDSLNNVQVLSHHEALTGPIQRGDFKTVQQHLNILQHEPTTLALYKILGQATLALTSLTEKVKEAFRKLLFLQF